MACYVGSDKDNNIKYHFKPFTALGLAESKKVPQSEFQDGISYKLNWVLKPGMKVILLKSKDEEIKLIQNHELLKRIYKISTVYPIYQGKYEFFYADADYRLNVVSTNIKLPKRGKETNFEMPTTNPLIRLNLSKQTFLIEGKDFEIKPDGTINWKF
ncbi:MAG: hypothetical protein JO072_16325 [Parafilimonas sp.]|nr:hypothetical protein [Parafilimonas sp.]